MATAITNIQSVLNVGTLSTPTTATADVANLAEEFTLTPTGSKFIVQVDNVSGSNGSVTFSLAAGTMWAKTVALTGTILQGTSQVLEVDTAKYLDGGDMALTITPASGKKLLTDHALTIQAIQLV